MGRLEATVRKKDKHVEVGIYDQRNRLNDLTGKEWLKLSKSVWISKRNKLDEPAFKHPAPFLIEDIKRLILLFSKKNQVILDPFMGSGSALVAATLLNRKGIGVDLNKSYCVLARKRLKDLKIPSKNYKIIRGNSLYKIREITDAVDYCVTSPPYHNILRNKGGGLRHDKSQRRQGIEYYSDNPDDIGNKENYSDFLLSLKEIMAEVYKKLKFKGYCTIIISDFTVNKKETNAHGDVISIMRDLGFSFEGTIILVQDSKPLYPFGYPYAVKLNHVHQYLLNFRKI
jgi:DNA modification methylase